MPVSQFHPFRREKRSLQPLSQRYTDLVDYSLELEQEVDGRWIAEVLELPGVLAYGFTPDDAIAKVKSLAERVLADR